MFEQVNEMAVLVSALLAIAVGSIWYSPLLFGLIWMRSIRQNVFDAPLSKSEVFRASIQGILIQTIFFVIVTQFIEMSLRAGVSLTTLCGFLLGLIGVQTANLMVWERRPLSYLLVHTGYTALVIFGGVGIIVYWPW